MISKYIQPKQLPEFLIAGYLTIAPFLILPNLGMYDSKRLIQIVLLSTLFFAFLFTSFGNGKQEKINISISITFIGGLVLIFGLISSIQSEFPQEAFTEILLFLILLLCIIELSKYTLKAHYQLGKLIAGTAILFTSIYLIYFLGNYIAAHLNPLVPMWPDRLAVVIQIGESTYRGTEVLNFAHKRFFNHLQTWTLPLLISTAFYYKFNTVYRNLMLGLISCWWLLVFASGARGTIVAIFIACAFLFILFRKRSYRFLAIATGTAFGGFLLYFLMFKVLVPSESLPVARMTDSGRWEMWAKAIEMWLANPILGAGPMHYAVIEGTPYFAHPHNFYLQVLSEWGAIVLISVLALLVFYAGFIKKRFLKNKFEFKELSYRNSVVYMGFFGSAIAGFAHAGVSGVFHTPMSQIWAIIIIAWLVSLWNRKSGHKNALTINRKYVSIALSILLISLFFLISSDFNNVYKNHTQYKEHFKEAKLYPRFWEQGLIYERNSRGQEKREMETRPEKQDQDG